MEAHSLIPEPPEIETLRLRLRLPPPTEASGVAAFFRKNLEHLRPFQPSLPADYVTETFWQAQLQGAKRAWRSGEVARWFIFDRGDSGMQPIGYVSLTSIRRGNCQSAELSYAIDSDRSGQGLMAEAVAAVIAYAWTELRLHRIDAKYRADNRRSGALLERRGFTRIGVAPAHAEIDGAWRDHMLTTLVRPEHSLAQVDE
jgi:ribosomal-protein-alanine N-acetyltransferase